MVTAPKIRCVVVVAGSENDRMPTPTRPRFRPSDLLPWADPHIRSLVERLQDEVRDEQAVPQPEPTVDPVERMLDDWAELDDALVGRFDGPRF